MSDTVVTLVDPLSILNGEGRWYRFTFSTSLGSAMDVSAWSFGFALKRNVNEDAYRLQKSDAEFNKVHAGSGLVSVNISASDSSKSLLPSGDYTAELRWTVTSGTEVEKHLAQLTVEKAVTD